MSINAQSAADLYAKRVGGAVLYGRRSCPARRREAGASDRDRGLSFSESRTVPTLGWRPLIGRLTIEVWSFCIRGDQSSYLAYA
jgi:hypothetical protein